MAYLRVLGDIEYKGIYIDPVRWETLYQQNLQKYKELRQELVDFIKENELKEFYDFQLSLFELDFDSPNLEVAINFSSSQQVVTLLNAFGISTKIFDKEKSKLTGREEFKDSVEARVLKKYKKHPVVKRYLELKTYEKAVTTYGVSFLRKHQNPATKRVHSVFTQILDTGRIASKNPNLQNIPNEKKFPGFRECFVAPTDKTCLIVADYASQESRILADASRDENMIHFFLEGDGDFHSYTARRMFKTHVDANTRTDLRALAKTLSFGIPYGMGPHKLATDFEISLEEAEKFINLFYDSYPKLKKYFMDGHKRVLTSGCILIDPITNRKSYCEPLFTKYVTAKGVIAKYQDEGKKVPSSL
jgi:DNA polymerase I-like protein with 3'-5' exonuclease and polymerase domains